ncbi:IclR family transcriptional regulator [Brevibacillus fluminis]|uniref:IclR family transcriptional regulator n=1 Tax=Brevibacillus fluminis TaxID=511487 RepID=UPI003F8B5B67
MPTDEQSEKSKNNGVQVIARAATILRALKDHPNGLSLGQIAQLVGMARSTVQRIIYALEEEGFVVSATASGGVRLGPGLALLAAAVRIDLREEVRPYLQQLSAEIDETVDLSILDHHSVLFLDQVTAPHRLQAISSIGASFPLHCTANGKAILAAMSDHEVERTLPAILESYTPHTITDKSRLMQELQTIRQTRVAYDREEHSLGICAVGSLIRDTSGKLAAVTIPMPAARFHGNEDRIIAALLKTCDAINQRFQTASTIYPASAR